VHEALRRRCRLNPRTVAYRMTGRPTLMGCWKLEENLVDLGAVGDNYLAKLHKDAS
jgi:hypothetical protein